MDAVAAAFVVTGTGDVLAPGWVGVRDGVIVEVAQGPVPRELHAEDGGPGSILIPGLVSAHTHLALGRLRSVADDRPFLDWIHNGILPALRDVGDDAEFFHAGAMQSCRELLAAGVTCAGDNFLRGEGVDALAATGQRGAFFQEVFGSLSADETAYQDEVDALLTRALEDTRVPVGFSPHTPWTCPELTFRRVADRAQREGRRLSFHLDESREEHDLFRYGKGALHQMLEARGILDRYRLGATPTAMLEELGALGPHSVAAHCVHVTEQDVAILARTGTNVAHCPVSNMKLAEGVAPILAMLEAGVTVGLGVDSAASTGKLDLFSEMRACLLTQRAVNERVGPLVANTVLEMATLGGAKCLGMESRVGSLEVGKAADLVLVRTEGLRHVPVRDPVATLVHTVTGDDVVLTFVGGVERFRRRP